MVRGGLATDEYDSQNREAHPGKCKPGDFLTAK